MLELALRAVMKKLKEAYPEFMIVAEADKVTKNKDSFFVEVNYSINMANTKYFNSREITVTITHVPKTKSERRKMNNIVEELNAIFNRFIKIDDRNILINNIKAQILKDSFGYYLVYSIQLPFLEAVMDRQADDPSFPHEYGLMEDIKFKLDNFKERN